MANEAKSHVAWPYNTFKAVMYNADTNHCFLKMVMQEQLYCSTIKKIKLKTIYATLSRPDITVCAVM